MEKLAKTAELITPKNDFTSPKKRTRLDKDSHPKKVRFHDFPHIGKGCSSITKALTTTAGMLLMLLVFSCDTGENPDAGEAGIKVSASEVPKREDTDIRDSYVIFRISAEESVTDYHLAVKESSETAPTAAEMTSGALKRNLGTEPINVLIAQRLNAPMVDFAKKFFADNTHQTLGAGMTGTMGIEGGAIPNYAHIHDDQASGSDAWVAQSVLAPSTGYKLYGLEANGGNVTELLSFRTDAESLETISTKSGTVEYMDTTLERKHIDIIINPDEIYIFPLQHKIPQGSIQGINIYYSGQVSGSILLLPPDFSVFGEPNTGFVYQMLLLADKGTFAETASRGMYVLLYTNPAKLSFADTALPPYFGINYNIDAESERILWPHLMGYPDIDTPADSPAATAVTTAENTITVTWSPVSYAGYALINNEWTGKISGYKVYYSDSIITESTDLAALTVQEAAASPAAINNLNHGTEYFFMVKTVSNVGESEPSELMRVTVHTPDPPQNVTLTSGSAGSGEVTISWTAPANAGYHYDGTNVTDGTISSYKVYYVLGSSSQKLTISTDLTTLNSVDVPSGTSATIGKLFTNAEYNFAVTAVNDTGESPVSEIITHTTP